MTHRVPLSIAILVLTTGPLLSQSPKSAVSLISSDVIDMDDKMRSQDESILIGEDTYVYNYYSGIERGPDLHEMEVNRVYRFGPNLEAKGDFELPFDRKRPTDKGYLSGLGDRLLWLHVTETDTKDMYAVVLTTLTTEGKVLSSKQLSELPQLAYKKFTTQIIRSPNEAYAALILSAAETSNYTDKERRALDGVVEAFVLDSAGEPQTHAVFDLEAKVYETILTDCAVSDYGVLDVLAKVDPQADVKRRRGSDVEYTFFRHFSIGLGEKEWISQELKLNEGHVVTARFVGQGDGGVNIIGYWSMNRDATFSPANYVGYFVIDGATGAGKQAGFEQKMLKDYFGDKVRTPKKGMQLALSSAVVLASTQPLADGRFASVLEYQSFERSENTTTFLRGNALILVHGLDGEIVDYKVIEKDQRTRSNVLGFLGMSILACDGDLGVTYIRAPDKASGKEKRYLGNAGKAELVFDRGTASRGQVLTLRDFGESDEDLTPMVDRATSASESHIVFIGSPGGRASLINRAKSFQVMSTMCRDK